MVFKYDNIFFLKPFSNPTLALIRSSARTSLSLDFMVPGGGVAGRGGARRVDVGGTTNYFQEKFEQICKELPQVVTEGCEIRAKNVAFSVQRPKGSADEPTVGDEFVSLGRCLFCLPILKMMAG